jgi:SAM-dependent methyltransferase
MTDVLSVGNSAKLYCLNRIEEYSQQRDRLSILDLGSGTALGFVPLLKKYPTIRYVGVEPSKSACLQAERNLDGLNGTIINAYGYGVHSKLQQEFDVVVSFSVLEHVYKRAEYLRSAKECLKNDGYFLINYDAGHFVMGTQRDRIKNVVGPLLARFGVERYYQSFVKEQEFRNIVKSLGFKIIDEKFFNTGLKGVYKLIPEPTRPDYMEKWLDLELWLNESGIVYDDNKASSFVTRNFIMQC